MTVSHLNYELKEMKTALDKIKRAKASVSSKKPTSTEAMTQFLEMVEERKSNIRSRVRDDDVDDEKVTDMFESLAGGPKAVEVPNVPKQQANIKSLNEKEDKEEEEEKDEEVVKPAKQILKKTRKTAATGPTGSGETGSTGGSSGTGSLAATAAADLDATAPTGIVSAASVAGDALAEETGGSDEETAEGSISTGGTGAGAETGSAKIGATGPIEETGAETGTTGASEKTGATGVGTGSTGVGTGATGVGTGSTGVGTGSTGVGTGSTGSATGTTSVACKGQACCEKGMIFKDGRCHIATPKEIEEAAEKEEEKEEEKSNSPMRTIEQRLEHAAKRDKGSEMRHEIKTLREMVNTHSKMPVVKNDIDANGSLLSKTKRERQLLRKVASLEHLLNHYTPEVKKLELHLGRTDVLLLHANDEEGKERLAKARDLAGKQLKELKAEIKHVNNLLFDARRALDFLHEKRSIRKKLNTGELHILKSVSPVLNVMEERILGHMELLRQHLKEENTNFEETTKMFESQMKPLQGPRKEEKKEVEGVNKEILNLRKMVRRVTQDRAEEERIGKMEMLECKDEIVKMTTRVGTLDDILDHLQETQLLVANKIAKLRFSWQRSLYRFKVATKSTKILGPTPFEDTPDKIKDGKMVKGTTQQLKNAMKTMYNEIIPPQQARLVNEESIPRDSVLRNVAKLDALISVEVDSGFETWKEAVDARNRSLDGAIVAKSNFEIAENSFATAEFELKEETKVFIHISTKYSRVLASVKALKIKIQQLTDVSEKLDAERTSYELKYSNAVADQEDALEQRKKLAQIQVNRATSLVSDQDGVISNAEEEEGRSRNTMERAEKQRKKLEELKAKAEGKTNEAKVTAKKRIINADASARFAEVAKDHLHNLAQATSFLEVRENPNKALADSEGLDAQLKKINAMEEKVHPSLKQKAAAGVSPNDEEKEFIKAGDKDDYLSVVSALQNSLKGLSSLNSKTLAKVQDNVEDALTQAEEDQKNARSDLSDAKETALAAEKRRAPLLKVLSKAQQMLKKVSDIKVTPSTRAMLNKKAADKIERREVDVKQQIQLLNSTLGNETVALAKVRKLYDQQKKVHENVTYIFNKAKKKLDSASYNKKRAEMEVIIRKKDLDIVTDMFKKVCDREEEKPNVRITLEHKCCLAYVVDCPGNRTKFVGYTNPKPQVPVNMRDDQETLVKLKREVTRLRLMKEGLSEETKEALAKAAAANKKKAEAEKEEEAESKKITIRKTTRNS
jgi:hypothetical protein